MMCRYICDRLYTRTNMTFNNTDSNSGIAAIIIFVV